jgi:hypothetical protein
MIVEIQTEVVVVDQTIQYEFVQDADLVYVGGGSDVCHF